MAKSVGIGVIGMGWMGQVHSRSYKQVPNRFREVGVVPRLIFCSDNIESRAKEAKRQLGFEYWVTDWQEVIADPEVEAVNITAPNHLHLDIVRAVTKAGKHIYCEKPVGRSQLETAEIASLAREAGILTLVGFNYRWAPLVQYAGQLIRGGEAGRVDTLSGKIPHRLRERSRGGTHLEIQGRDRGIRSLG